MFGLRRLGLLVLVAGSATVVAGCTGSSGSSTAPSPTAPSSGATSSSGSAESPAAIAVTPGMLGPGWQMKVVPGGTSVAGQVTLDLCGGGYASEQLRAARRQTALKDGPIVLSNEVVRYSDGGAARAYTELKARAAHCPNHPVAMPEAGSPRVRFTIRPLRGLHGLTAHTVAVRITVTSGTHVVHGFGVYQFAGDWLAAVYSFQADPAALQAVTHVAHVEAARLRSAGGTSV